MVCKRKRKKKSKSSKNVERACAAAPNQVWNNNHAVPHSHYIRWGHHHEWPSGIGRTALTTADTTP